MKTSNQKSIIRGKIVAYVMITLASIVYTIGIQAFMVPAKLFPMGLGAIGTMITYVVNELQSYYSLIYLALNIPLIIIFWNKSRKSFMVRTMYFLIVQASFGSLFIIPQINDSFGNVFSDLEPFRETTTINNVLEEPTVWPIIIMALFASLLGGLSIAVTWKYGGSSAGTDIVVYFYSTKRKKAVGKIATMISAIILIFSFSINLILEPINRKFWYITVISTLAYIAIANMLIDWIYPKYSKVEISIHSSKPIAIAKYLSDASNFKHAFSKQEVISGYTGKKKVIIKSVVLLLETKNLKRNLKEIDPNVWISIIDVREVLGKYSTKTVDEHEI